MRVRNQAEPDAPGPQRHERVPHVVVQLEVLVFGPVVVDLASHGSTPGPVPPISSMMRCGVSDEQLAS